MIPVVASLAVLLSCSKDDLSPVSVVIDQTSEPKEFDLGLEEE